MRTMLSINHKEKLRPQPVELDLISRVFKKAGGSWERVFKGSIRDMVLLKKVMKIAVDKGRITKPPTWS